MVGMGVVELILLAMLAGGSVPQQVAFGNPVIWLAQSMVTRAMPAGGVAGMWLMLESPVPPVPLGGPPVQIGPPAQVAPATPTP